MSLPENQNRKKSRRRLIIVGRILVILFVIIYFSSEMVIENLVSREINKQINDRPSSLYELETGKVNLRFLKGAIEIENVVLHPTDSAIQLIENAQIKSLVRLDLQDFELDGLKILRFLRKKKMDISNVSASGIHLDLFTNPDVEKKHQKESISLKDIFTDQFVEASISKLQIRDLAFRYFNTSDTAQPQFSLDSLYLTFSEVQVDTNTLRQNIPVNFENLKINSSDIVLNTSEYYKIATDDIGFNMQDSSLVVDGFRLIPRYTREAFNQRMKYNTDWFNIVVPRITLRNIHLSHWIGGNIIHLGSIEIEQPDLDIYRDKNLPDAPFKHKPLLASSLRKIPANILVDSLLIRNGVLKYGELSEKASDPGEIYFEPFSITAYNLTNADSIIAEQSSLLLTFEGSIMGKTSLQAHIKADLTSEKDYFEIDGKLGRMPASALNPMIENLLFVSIQSGDIKGTNFYFYADDHESSGEVFLEYEDLKVDVLNTEDHEKKKAAQSFIANNLIRNSNLNSDRKYLVGQINFERDKNKGIVNYVWNSVKTGVISIIAPVASKDNKAEKRKRSDKRKNKS